MSTLSSFIIRLTKTSDYYVAGLSSTGKCHVSVTKIKKDAKPFKSILAAISWASKHAERGLGLTGKYDVVPGPGLVPAASELNFGAARYPFLAHALANIFGGYLTAKAAAESEKISVNDWLNGFVGGEYSNQLKVTSKELDQAEEAIQICLSDLISYSGLDKIGIPSHGSFAWGSFQALRKNYPGIETLYRIVKLHMPAEMV